MKHKTNPKSNGLPYVKKAEEKYKKLSQKEKAKVDKFAKELDKIIGDD